MKTIIFILFFTIFLLSSCDREINIDLNKTYPRYVIDGNLSTDSGESYVLISKTLNFDQTMAFPNVSGAFVTITDNTINKTDTLTESVKGIYINPDLKGTEGHSYTLMVKTDEEVFTSVSAIPYPLKFDSIIQQNNAEDGIPEPPGNMGTGPIIQFLPAYSNTTHTDSYFQFMVFKNRTPLSGIIVRKDMGSTEITSLFPIFIQAKKNDFLKIDMQCFDIKVYDYLYGLSQNLYQMSATPSNPKSNISNGALGFFKAHSTQKKSIIIK